MRERSHGGHHGHRSDRRDEHDEGHAVRPARDARRGGGARARRGGAHGQGRPPDGGRRAARRHADGAADTVGPPAPVLNLPTGATTTTLESKTNFFAAGRAGVVRAETTPLHRGKRTMVWQTRVTDESGRLLSLTIQTQMVLTKSARDAQRGD